MDDSTYEKLYEEIVDLRHEISELRSENFDLRSEIDTLKEIINRKIDTDQF